MKIAHLADIQINIDARNADRTSEYRSALFDCAQQIIDNGCDVIVLAGDIFERYSTTDNEREMYAQFVHALLNGLPACKIIVIDGNHDLRKRNLEYYDGSNTSLQTNVLAEINAAINSERYLYSRNSKLYKIGNVVFACWSESARYDQQNFTWSPWQNVDTAAIERQLADCTIFDVFHGTLPGAKDLGNDFEFTPDNVKFRGHYAMLGHIHKYQQLGKAVYSSSLVQRTFNEGIRRTADATIYDYSNDHGWVLWEVNDKQVTHKFMPVFQPVLMLALVMNQHMTKAKVLDILKDYAGRSLSIKLVLDSPDAEALAFMYNYVGKQPNCKIKKVESVQAKIDNAKFTETVSTIELTTESFTSIATEVLKPIIDERHRTDKQYAADVLNKTLQLLAQECGYHLHAESRSKIRLNSVDISNFKTIGKATIDFAEHGLQALRGQNGQGKTTCFEAIAFALTGQHNRTFKRNAKNKQFLRLFNDKQPGTDIVKISVALQIDGEQYEVLCMLHKFMQDDWTPANWKSKVAKITKTLQIFNGDKMICQDADADDWLMQRFGTYDDFAVLHLLDQSTLEAIKYMTPDELSNFILQRLGYSVITKLQYYYNGCKANALLETPKPTDKSYVDLYADIEQLEQSISNAKAQLDEMTDERGRVSTNISTYQESINFEQRKRKTLPADLIATWQNAVVGYDNATVDALIATIDERIAKYQSELQSQQRTIDTFNNVKRQVDAEMLRLVDAARLSIERMLQESNTKQQALTDELSNVIAINDGLARQRTDLQTQIVQVRHDIDTLVVKHNNANAVYLATKERHEGDMQIIESDIAVKQTQLDSMRVGHCPLCQSKINVAEFEQHRQEIVDAINDLRSKLEDIKAKVLQLTTDMDNANTVFATEQQSLQGKLKALQQQFDAVPANTDATVVTSSLNSEIGNMHSLQDKLGKLSKPDYQMQLLQLNNVDLHNSYVAAETAYSKLDSTLADTLAAEQKLSSAANSARFAFTQLAAYESIMADNKKIDDYVLEYTARIQSEQARLAELQNGITLCSENIAKYNSSIANVREVQQRLVAFNICNEALQHYKSLIFDILPKHLYVNVCNVINSYIDSQNLPSGIRPWLSEEHFGQIVLRDRMEDGQEICRPIIEASGMEITIAGLVICLALHEAKLAVDFPMVLLDELSGKLSTGTTTDPTNYLDLLWKVLNNASMLCQLVIIDHRLDDDCFDNVTTIAKDKVTNVSYTL